MRIHSTLTILVGIITGSGCTVGHDKAKKVKSDSEAKIRADAARKEMETLTKTFQTPDYFKKNGPEIKAESVRQPQTKR